MPNEREDILALGFDFGLKRIGVATGQSITGTATPLCTITCKQQGIINWNHVAQLITEWRPTALVVGIPLNMDDSEQELTQKAKAFALLLKSRYHLPVYCVDERLTTIEARQQLFEAGGYKKLHAAEVDSVAAMIILQTWLTATNKEDFRL